ncbi:hypothetical protein B4113_3209 [Geobacillus sp. B4113_201601]|nr:hypothetical protein B4113_3209 [Geobacillus sp. B4113_201601]
MSPRLLAVKAPCIKERQDGENDKKEMVSCVAVFQYNGV